MVVSGSTELLVKNLNEPATNLWSYVSLPKCPHGSKRLARYPPESRLQPQLQGLSFFFVNYFFIVTFPLYF